MRTRHIHHSFCIIHFNVWVYCFFKNSYFSNWFQCTIWRTETPLHPIFRIRLRSLFQAWPHRPCCAQGSPRQYRSSTRDRIHHEYIMPAAGECVFSFRSQYERRPIWRCKFRSKLLMNHADRTGHLWNY